MDINTNSSQNKSESEILLTQECYLYFPKNEEIYLRTTEPKKQINRKIFHVLEYDPEEEKKYEILKTQIKNIGSNKIMESISSNKNLMIRHLNYNKYDVFQTVSILKSFIDICNKMDIDSLNVENNESIQNLISSGFINVIGRDKCFRPIVSIEFKNLEKIEFNQKDLIEFILYFFNYVIEKMMLPGQIEQLTIIMKTDGINSSNFIGNFKEIIYFIQMCYPSRLHKMYVISIDKKQNNSFNLIENFFFPYNKERVILINKKARKGMLKEMDQKLVKEILFNEFCISNISQTHITHESINLINNSTQFQRTFMNEEYQDNSELNNNNPRCLEVEEYLNFMKDERNSNHYNFCPYLIKKEGESTISLNTSTKVISKLECSNTNLQEISIKRSENKENTIQLTSDEGGIKLAKSCLIKKDKTLYSRNNNNKPDKEKEKENKDTFNELIKPFIGDKKINSIIRNHNFSLQIDVKGRNDSCCVNDCLIF